MLNTLYNYNSKLWKNYVYRFFFKNGYDKKVLNLDSKKYGIKCIFTSFSIACSIQKQVQTSRNVSNAIKVIHGTIPFVEAFSFMKWSFLSLNIKQNKWG